MSATARLMAILGMDASQFTRGMDQASQRTKGFGSMLSGVKGKIAAAFTVGAVLKVGKDALALGDDISETASNLGITTDELQALAFMFNTTGSSAEKFELAMNRVNTALGDVNNLAPGALEKLAKMGITLDTVDAGPVAVLSQMAKYLYDNGQSAAALSDVFDVLGEKSRNMANGLMELGKSGPAAIIKAAKESGNVIDKTEIAALGKTQDQVDLIADGLKKRASETVGWWANYITEKMAKKKPAGAAKLTPDNPDTLEEVNKKLNSTGPAQRERADQLAAAKLTEEAADIRKKNAFDALDTEGKILALKQEQMDLETKMAAAKTMAARAELDKRLAETEGAIAGLEGGNQGPGMAYDQLRRVGAGVYSGTAADAVPKNQLLELRKIAVSMHRIENRKPAGSTF